jgi:hypothetical protein
MLRDRGLIEIKPRERGGARIAEAMDADALQPRIEHEIAELRGLFPAIAACHSALLQTKDDGGARWSLHLDIRAPQAQVIVSGPAEESAEAAIAAAGRMARERLAALPRTRAP